MAALGVLWFLAFLALVPFVPLQANGVPAPWYERVYAAGVTVAFAAILATAFRSLGHPESRSYLGLARPQTVQPPSRPMPPSWFSAPVFWRATEA